MKKVIIFGGICASFLSLSMINVNAQRILPESYGDPTGIKVGEVITPIESDNDQIQINSCIAQIKIDASNINSPFGKLKLDNLEIIKEAKKTYQSFFFANDYCETYYDSKAQYIYSTPKYVDLPINDLESFRLEKGEEFTQKFETTNSIVITSTQAIDVGYKCFNSNKTTVGITGGVTAGYANIGASISNEFYVSNESSYNYSSSYTDEELCTERKEKVETYKNNYDSFCIVRRCIRQQFKVYYCIEAGYNYRQNEYTVNWLDKGYSYDFKKMTYTKFKIALVPFNRPYYDISYYLNKNGIEQYAKDKTNNVLYL